MLIELYCPAVTEGGSRPIENVRRALLEKFGGVTMLNGSGAWINPEGKVEGEPVCVIRVVCDYLHDGEHDEVVAIAKRFKEEAKQTAVLFTINNCVYTLED